MKWSRGYQRMIFYHLVHHVFIDRVTRIGSLQHWGLQKSLSFQLYSASECLEFGKNFNYWVSLGKVYQLLNWSETLLTSSLSHQIKSWLTNPMIEIFAIFWPFIYWIKLKRYWFLKSSMLQRLGSGDSIIEYILHQMIENHSLVTLWPFHVDENHHYFCFCVIKADLLRWFSIVLYCM